MTYNRDSKANFSYTACALPTRIRNHFPAIRLVSMVTVGNIGQAVAPRDLCRYLPNYVYEPDQFPAVFYRVKNPCITFTIFASGKVIAHGGRKLADVRDHFRKLLSFLEPLGIRATTATIPKISMLVGSGAVATRLDLERLAERLPNVEYRTNGFPALSSHFDRCVVALVFRSGRVVITGVRSVGSLHDIFNRILAVAHD